LTIEFKRTKANSDGTKTNFVPAKNRDNYFVMSDGAVVKQLNRRENNFYLKDAVAVAARLRKSLLNGRTLRMRMRPENGAEQNLIAASEIEIIET